MINAGSSVEVSSEIERRLEKCFPYLMRVRSIYERKFYTACMTSVVLFGCEMKVLRALDVFADFIDVK